MTIVKTYVPDGHRMRHDGYFLLVDEFPLKWISVEAFDALPSPNQPNYKELVNV